MSHVFARALIGMFLTVAVVTATSGSAFAVYDVIVGADLKNGFGSVQAQAQDFQSNGATALCTPTGPGPCAPISQVIDGVFTSGFASLDLAAGSASLAGQGIADVAANFGLFLVLSAPGDVVLHLDYGWDVNPGSFMTLRTSGYNGSNPGTPYDVDVALSGLGTASVDITHAATPHNFGTFAAGFTVAFGLVTRDADAMTANLSFWLELPEGVTLLSDIGGVPMSDPASGGGAAVPGPGGLGVLIALVPLYLRARR